MKHLAILPIVLCLVVPSLAQNKPVKIACVGDSITFGAGVKDRDKNCYPVQLQNLLGDAYKVQNFGVSGSTLLKNGDKPYWKEKAFAQAKAFEPDVVIIKLGTNDSKPQNWKHKDQFAPDAAALVEAFAALPSKPKVYLCRPVPAYPGNWGISDEVIKNEVIPQLDKVAKEKGLPVIDLYAALSNHKEFFPDKVHPNAEGAGVMAKTIAEKLKSK